jgi:phytoene desaturase
MTNKKVVIIGAGIGGLATAALLGKEGFEVTVIEKNAMVGGRASIWKSKGFTFDMGPSWYLMPDVFENYFKKFGKKASDLMDLRRLDPNYRVFFGKEDFTDLSADMKKNYALFESLEVGSGKKIKKFLDKAKSEYELAMKYILYKEFRSLKDFISFDLMREGRKINLISSVSYTHK